MHPVRTGKNVSRTPKYVSRTGRYDFGWLCQKKKSQFPKNVLDLSVAFTLISWESCREYSLPLRRHVEGLCPSHIPDDLWKVRLLPQVAPGIFSIQRDEVFLLIHLGAMICSVNILNTSSCPHKRPYEAMRCSNTWWAHRQSTNEIIYSSGTVGNSSRVSVFAASAISMTFLMYCHG